MRKIKRILLNFLCRQPDPARFVALQSAGPTRHDAALHRRRFIGCIAGLVGCFLVLKGNVIVALAKTRRLLSANTDLSNLIYENPAGLDIRKLPVTELSKFGVSGTDDHIADMTTWHLEIKGLVGIPGRLSYTKIKALPKLERKILLICPGTFAYIGRWRGFSLWDLLEQHGISKDATHINIKGPPEKYRKVVQFHLEEIKNGRVFLAYAANGRILSIKYGFPLRAVAQYQVGARWVKYVYEIEAVHRKEPLPPKDSPVETDGSAFFP